MISAEIKNIIFDLGGVIINLSVEATINRFSRLTGLSAEFLQEKLLRSDLFMDHEKGAVTDPEFRNSIRTILNITCTDEEIDACWNEMLLDIPLERIALLLHVKKEYRTFLLSNTNEIHWIRFSSILNELGYSFDDLFEKVYYSHRMNMRKPDKEIFEYVLRENNLAAEETLFLDDNVDNLKGAASIGIKTFHVHQPDAMFTLFDFPR